MYAYLGECNTASNYFFVFDGYRGEEAFESMRAHKAGLGWTIVDIKGISPSLCMHKILMEDIYKPTIQPQSLLNPIAQEVIKKEVLKLLDAGMIHPIFDSSWVSPVQVVPKKGWITVVQNDNNELIQLGQPRGREFA